MGYCFGYIKEPVDNCKRMACMSHPLQLYRTRRLKRLQTIFCIHPCLHLTIQSKSCIFQRIINRQSIQAPLGIWSGSYPGFCLITVNPEDVAVIVVNVDAVVHRVISCVYQFHCYQSFRLNWR